MSDASQELYYHGTHADLKPGNLIKVGYKPSDPTGHHISQRHCVTIPQISAQIAIGRPIDNLFLMGSLPKPRDIWVHDPN